MTTILGKVVEETVLVIVPIFSLFYFEFALAALILAALYGSLGLHQTQAARATYHATLYALLFFLCMAHLSHIMMACCDWVSEDIFGGWPYWFMTNVLGGWVCGPFAVATYQVPRHLLFVVLLFFFILVCLGATAFRSDIEARNFVIFALIVGNILVCSLLLKVTHVVALWFFLETLTILSTFLILQKGRDGALSAYQYLVFNGLGGLWFIWGIILLLPFMGTTEAVIPHTPLVPQLLVHIPSAVETMSTALTNVIPQTIEGWRVTLTVILAFLLMFFGLLMKLGLAPFHFWMVAVYEHVTWEVFFIFSALNKYILTILFYRIMGCMVQVLPVTVCNTVRSTILIFVIGSMGLGVLGAFGEKNLRRLLTYTSLVQLAYVVLGFICSDPAASEGALAFMFFYALSLLGLFAVFFLLHRAIYTTDLVAIFFRKPLIAILATVCLMSQAGIPPFVGFLAKFAILTPVLGERGVLVTLYVLLIGCIAAIIYLRVLCQCFIQPVDTGATQTFAPEVVVPPVKWGFWLDKPDNERIWPIVAAVLIAIGLLGATLVFGKLLYTFFATAPVAWFWTWPWR